MNVKRNYTIIGFSVLIALILTLLPVPDWIVWLRPAWVMMVIFYWMLMQPEDVGVGIAWLAGIVLDILEGTLLGEHALAMTIVAYFTMRFYLRLRLYPIMQQSFSILIFAFIYYSILYCIQGFVGALPPSNLYWLAPVTTMVFWPCVYIILQDSRRRVRVEV